LILHGAQFQERSKQSPCHPGVDAVRATAGAAVFGGAELACLDIAPGKMIPSPGRRSILVVFYLSEI
jgi:hypothetical protein